MNKIGIPANKTNRKLVEFKEMTSTKTIDSGRRDILDFWIVFEDVIGAGVAAPLQANGSRKEAGNTDRSKTRSMVGVLRIERKGSRKSGENDRISKTRSVVGVPPYIKMVGVPTVYKPDFEGQISTTVLTVPATNENR